MQRNNDAAEMQKKVRRELCSLLTQEEKTLEVIWAFSGKLTRWSLVSGPATELKNQSNT